MCYKIVTNICFNPRTHAGCDEVVVNGEISDEVSIHAPTRGATIGGKFITVIALVSIHAPTRGATSEPFAGKM